MRLAHVLLLITILACAPNNSHVDRPAELTIMSFNVENLFDSRHDQGKNDYTYLPLIQKQSSQHKARCAQVKVPKWRDECLNWDWSEVTVAHKLQVLSAAIRQANDGRGPDVLVLQEVENRNIVEQLRQEFLSGAGYLPTILIEGNDLRGIDIAILSRLPLSGIPVLHKIPFAGVSAERLADTRGILESTFVLPDGELLTGFGVHFPAPFHPWQMRKAAYQYLNKLRKQLPEDRMVFAVGDFNTPSDEDRRRQLLKKYVRPHWLVAHENGCVNCRGTYYYAPLKQWSYLDMLLWSPGANNTWQFVAGSTNVENALPQQLTEQGHPHGYELPGRAGVSDHWPISMKIRACQSDNEKACGNNSEQE